MEDLKQSLGPTITFADGTVGIDPQAAAQGALNTANNIPQTQGVDSFTMQQYQTPYRSAIMRQLEGAAAQQTAIQGINNAVMSKNAEIAQKKKEYEDAYKAAKTRVAQRAAAAAAAQQQQLSSRAGVSGISQAQAPENAVKSDGRDVIRSASSSGIPNAPGGSIISTIERDGQLLTTWRNNPRMRELILYDSLPSTAIQETGKRIVNGQGVEEYNGDFWIRLGDNWYNYTGKNVSKRAKDSPSSNIPGVDAVVSKKDDPSYLETVSIRNGGRPVVVENELGEMIKLYENGKITDFDPIPTIDAGGILRGDALFYDSPQFEPIYEKIINDKYSNLEEVKLELAEAYSNFQTVTKEAKSINSSLSAREYQLYSDIAKANDISQNNGKVNNDGTIRAVITPGGAMVENISVNDFYNALGGLSDEALKSYGESLSNIVKSNDDPNTVAVAAALAEMVERDKGDIQSRDTDSNLFYRMDPSNDMAIFGGMPQDEQNEGYYLTGKLFSSIIKDNMPENNLGYLTYNDVLDRYSSASGDTQADIQKGISRYIESERQKGSDADTAGMTVAIGWQRKIATYDIQKTKSFWRSVSDTMGTGGTLMSMLGGDALTELLLNATGNEAKAEMRNVDKASSLANRNSIVAGADFVAGMAGATAPILASALTGGAIPTLGAFVFGQNALNAATGLANTAINLDDLIISQSDDGTISIENKSKSQQIGEVGAQLVGVAFTMLNAAQFLGLPVRFPSIAADGGGMSMAKFMRYMRLELPLTAGTEVASELFTAMAENRDPNIFSPEFMANLGVNLAIDIVQDVASFRRDTKGIVDSRIEKFATDVKSMSETTGKSVGEVISESNVRSRLIEQGLSDKQADAEVGKILDTASNMTPEAFMKNTARYMEEARLEQQSVAPDYSETPLPTSDVKATTGQAGAPLGALAEAPERVSENGKIIPNISDTIRNIGKSTPTAEEAQANAAEFGIWSLSAADATAATKEVSAAARSLSSSMRTIPQNLAVAIEDPVLVVDAMISAGVDVTDRDAIIKFIQNEVK